MPDIKLMPGLVETPETKLPLPERSHDSGN
ncbi:hypothetical protein SNOG_11521 [Parastagonospora nodorum SN15]|uniref:Uncharacterized protein n=1 Tax=Phaeosphaeria nodorum (strain SN15 / ATCC MYA-4574 / FGSC 10173) TaxID=321614 RepID=Q0U9P3_PHANO|nr:hypothetical protein SNOG_11521 [Parastagonospora nodorum SN15]EAT81229.1 hypothetical protein SNOG_11521 [Parastagonospora nodorum SN15]